MPFIRQDEEARFWRFANPDPNTGCWLWGGFVQGNGYAMFPIKVRPGEPKRSSRAHRWAYEHFVGPIPNGLEPDHLCRVRCCVNPDHLEPVTRRENTLRGKTLAAENVKKTHCPNGHPYSPENVYVYNRQRSCKTCTKARARAAKSRAHARGPT